jgi:hypothetical protein
MGYVWRYFATLWPFLLFILIFYLSGGKKLFMFMKLLNFELIYLSYFGYYRLFYASMNVFDN